MSAMYRERACGRDMGKGRLRPFSTFFGTPHPYKCALSKPGFVSCPMLIDCVDCKHFGWSWGDSDMAKLVRTKDDILEASKPHYFTGQGFFRLFLAFLVFFGHSASDYFGMNAPLGTIGVFGFFVVSGFVIFSAAEASYRERPIAFLINRGLKIYPIFWVIYTTTVVALYMAGPDTAIRRVNINNLDVSNYLSGMSIGLVYFQKVSSAWNPLGPAWSLGIELQFYGAVFFLLCATKMRAQQTALFLAGLGAIVACLVVVGAGLQQTIFGSIQYAPLFVLGAALFYCIRKPPSLSLLALTTLAVVTSVYQTWVYTGDSLSQALSVFGLICLFGVVIYVSVPRRFHHLDSRCGDITYAVYLVHLPIMGLFDFYSIPANPLTWGVLFGAVLIISLSLHVLIEQPIASLRTRMRGAPIKYLN
jgi:peptidoglycan/LPS O-acetylase OafA/YrhL